MTEVINLADSYIAEAYQGPVANAYCDPSGHPYRGPRLFKLEPPKFDEGTLPVFLKLEQLRELKKAQADDFKLLAATMARARAEYRFANAYFAGDALAERRRVLKGAGTYKGRKIHQGMAKRAKTAALTAKFYEQTPGAIEGSELVHSIMHADAKAQCIMQLFQKSPCCFIDTEGFPNWVSDVPIEAAEFSRPQQWSRIIFE
jgi:hypothetical protein